MGVKLAFYSTRSFLGLPAKAGMIPYIIPIMVWRGVEAQSKAFVFGFLLFFMVPLSLLFGWMAGTLPKN